MSAIVMRTGYLAVPEEMFCVKAQPSESFTQRLTRMRINQAAHYKMLTQHKLGCPVQYQGVLFSFNK